jgi:lipopolysaccharide export system protein LptC
MVYKNILLSFVMMIVIVLAAWTTLRPKKISIYQTSSLPDAFMEDVISIVMDKEGNPKMQIITPKMTHFVENDTTHLVAPKLTLYRKSPVPWNVTSKFAKTTQGTENVDFWGDVLIHHPGDGSNPATTIKTTTLTIYPNKNIAETDDLITLMQPNLVVKATGMHADMNTGDIKLKSRARGEYAPHS